MRLEDLVELEAFAVGAGDVEVPAAVGPEGEEDGRGLEDGVAGGLEGEEGGVDVGDIEGDVIDVAVAARADLGEGGCGEFIELEDNVAALQHGDVAGAFGVREGGGHDVGEAEASVEGFGGGEVGDWEAGVLEAVDVKV